MTVIQIESYGKSDIGLTRQNNEDVWAEVPARHFYVLADGMGGHRAGEVAAESAVKTLCKLVKSFPDVSTEELASLLHDAIVGVNDAVYDLSCEDDKYTGMGTTLCCLLFHDHYLIAGNVGDSRLYQWRKNRLTQISHDHSLRAELIASGQIEPDQDFPYKNIITRSIGTMPSTEPDIETLPVLAKDLYFLCSDGLTDCVDDDEIAQILKSSDSIQEATDSLIERAKEKGGNDNITILMMKVLS